MHSCSALFLPLCCCSCSLLALSFPLFAEWVRCSKHLNQWEVLRDFANNIGSMDLQWETAWRLGDWAALREMAQRHQQSDVPNAKLYQISLAIHESKNYETIAHQAQVAAAVAGAPPAPQQLTITERDIEKLIDTSIQLSLREWQQYPSFVSNAHVILLQRFERLVELNESSVMLTDMLAAQRNSQFPNFRSFITTWKERLLNKVCLLAHATRLFFCVARCSLRASTHTRRRSPRFCCLSLSLCSLCSLAKRAVRGSACLE